LCFAYITSAERLVDTHTSIREHGKIADRSEVVSNPPLLKVWHPREYRLIIHKTGWSFQGKEAQNNFVERIGTIKNTTLFSIVERELRTYKLPIIPSLHVTFCP
jgi:hypothetical protein